jgi:small-conductance mechanosensitive channel
VPGVGPVTLFGADHDPATLIGSCGNDPGLACRLVWNVSHNGRAATLTSEFLAGPVHLLLQILFVVVLALIIQWIVHRLVNRLTELASQSLLPQLRSGMTNSRFVPSRGAAGRVSGRLAPRRRRSPTDDGLADDAAAARAENLQDVPPGELVTAGLPGGDAAAAAADGASQGMVNGVAAQAEAALVDERRKQRVQALGAILRSVASVTIFAIAGFVVLGDLGINLAPLLASAGVVGVAVGFGAQSLVKD